MARKLILIGLGVLLGWGLFRCEQAWAGKWIKTGTTFNRGWHLVCTYSDMVDRVSGPTCLAVWCEGDMGEVNKYIEVWNEPPILEVESFWYKLENNYWIPIIPPFKYIEGLEM